MSSDPAIFDEATTSAGLILRWSLGWVLVPLGFLLAVAALRDVTGQDIQRALMLFAPACVLMLLLAIGRKLPFLAWVLCWPVVIVVLVSSIAMVLLGLLIFITLPAGIIGLVSSLGIAKALERTGEDGLHGPMVPKKEYKNDR